jgi:hypothetical protein
MSSATYRIETLQDLLRVPLERRAACFRDMGTSLALHELAFGEKAASIGIGAIIWTDDDNMSVALQQPDGSAILTMTVEKG